MQTTESQTPYQNDPRTIMLRTWCNESRGRLSRLGELICTKNKNPATALNGYVTGRLKITGDNAINIIVGMGVIEKRELNQNPSFTMIEKPPRNTKPWTKYYEEKPYSNNESTVLLRTWCDNRYGRQSRLSEIMYPNHSIPCQGLSHYKAGHFRILPELKEKMLAAMQLVEQRERDGWYDGDKGKHTR